VWVCREGVRKSLKPKPLEFGSKELLLNYAKVFIKRKFNFDLEKIFKQSKLLKNLRTQRKLGEFVQVP